MTNPIIDPIIDTAAVLLPQFPAVWEHGYIDLDELPAYASSGEEAIARLLADMWTGTGSLGGLSFLDPEKRAILLDLIEQVCR